MPESVPWPPPPNAFLERRPAHGTGIFIFLGSSALLYALAFTAWRFWPF